MIFHKAKNSFPKPLSFYKGSDKQAGVTLLLSLLVLAAITAVAFSLATITFVEIRASGDVLRTEPALYATQGVLEEAIFKIKRTAPVTYDTGLNGVALNNPVPKESTNQDPGLIDKVLATSQHYGGTSNVTQNIYYLVNPANPYADADSNQSWDGNYTRITLTNKSSSNVSLMVAICRIWTTDCVDATGNFTANQGGYSPVLLSPGRSQSFSLDGGPTPAADSSYVVYVINNSQGAGDGFVQIDLTDNTSTAIGLPYFNKKSVDVTATYLGLTRKYRAIIPTY